MEKIAISGKNMDKSWKLTFWPKPRWTVCFFFTAVLNCDTCRWCELRPRTRTVSITLAIVKYCYPIEKQHGMKNWGTIWENVLEFWPLNQTLLAWRDQNNCAKFYQNQFITLQRSVPLFLSRQIHVALEIPDQNLTSFPGSDRASLRKRILVFFCGEYHIYSTSTEMFTEKCKIKTTGIRCLSYYK